MNTKLSLEDVIYRSMLTSTDDIEPLVKYLEMEDGILKGSKARSVDTARAIAQRTRTMGSNDFATLFRGGTGVAYEEVVIDVGEKIKADVSADKNVEANEEAILWKMFADSLEKMSETERRELFSSLGFKEYDLPVGATATIIAQQLARQYGGFAVYKASLTVANMVARALLGRGLAFATNTALTRTIGAALGPIGWIASGVWLAVDIAGPAYRATVPAVIHIAQLRQQLLKRITIGVVGDGSSGKDSLIHAVFSLDSDINPVAGSTQQARVYDLEPTGSIRVINYPGFNDYRSAVNEHVDDYLHHTDIFVLVVDANRGISGTDQKILENIKAFNKPVLICLNKMDMARSPADREKLRAVAEERLHGYVEMFDTAFDPDPRLGPQHTGAREVHAAIVEQIAKSGKLADLIPAYQGD